MSDYIIYPYDCIDAMLHLMDEKSVHCCVTSPPYFGLRDYGTARWEGGDSACDHAPAQNWVSDGGDLRRSSGALPANEAKANTRRGNICSCGARRSDDQIGLEETPDAYVKRIVAVARAIRRVLRDDGTLWLNLGDSYANDGKWGGSSGGKHVGALHGATNIGRGKVVTGIKPKELIGIPWRVAFALQADGWYLRQDIIWNKPNPMPESVRDRCTKAHEYMFLLTKSPRYYFDAEAIKEPSVTGDTRRPYGSPGANMLDPRNAQGQGKPRKSHSFKRTDSKRGVAHVGQNVGTHRPDRPDVSYDGPMRNRRDVWTVSAKPFKGAHFATFPPDLIEPCVLAGSPTACCATCGAPRVRVVTKGELLAPPPSWGADATGNYDGQGVKDYAAAGVQNASDVKRRILEGNRERYYSWEASCTCNAPDAPATVLDPFGGSGTTAMVALRHGRRAVLCEINAEYIELAHKRIALGK